MDGYVRVSKRMGRAGPGYISPKVQREAIERWAEYRGIEIVKWHEDEDHSGGTQQRPGIREAVRRIEAGETEGVACWRLNRFARNVSEAIKDVERIEAADAHLALVQEDIDTTGAFGKMILTILLAVATLERDNIAEGWKTAKERAVKRGVRIAPPIIGYERGPGGVLEPHPEDGPLMKRVYRVVAAEGVPAGVEMLRTAHPERTWTTAVLRRILGSRTYLGEIVHGEFVNPTAHKALVNRGEWEAAQVPAKSKKRKSHEYPLSGVLLCANCKRPMVGSATSKYRVIDGERTKDGSVRVYRCKYDRQGHQGETECDAPAVVTAERAEDYVRFAWERMLAGIGVTIQAEPATDTAAAQEALDDAEAELYAFASDMTMRRALGGKYHEMQEARIRAVEEAKHVLAEQTRDQLQREQITPREVTENPAKLGEAAHRAFRSIEVLRGRNLPIGEKLILNPYGMEDRLSLRPEDFPQPA